MFAEDASPVQCAGKGSEQSSSNVPRSGADGKKELTPAAIPHGGA